MLNLLEFAYKICQRKKENGGTLHLYSLQTLERQVHANTEVAANTWWNLLFVLNSGSSNSAVVFSKEQQKFIQLQDIRRAQPSPGRNQSHKMPLGLRLSPRVDLLIAEHIPDSFLATT